MSKNRRQRKGADASYLDGQMLIAMPAMSDKRFHRSVIYMCSHSDKGAMGLIVNQRATNVSFTDLLVELKIARPSTEPRLPITPDMTVHIGGPVSAERGFVLHSNEYFVETATLAIDDGVCLTATVDILKALARGTGPKHALLALGYSGWGPGQLEAEIQANGWLHCNADKDLIFGADLDLKYPRALSKIGVDMSHLVSEAGHA